jgi:hypothetical protein
MGRQRNQIDLDALFLDNQARLITPENIRDFVESAVPSRGFMTLLSGSTTISAPSVWTKASNLTSLGNSYRLSMPSNNKMEYSGATNCVGFVVLSLTLSASSNNQVLSASLFKNGILASGTILDTKVGTSGDLQTITSCCSCVASPGDYMEVYLQNTTSTASISITKGSVVFMGFLS